MRFLTRLHTCVAAVVVLFLYFSWTRSSLHIQSRIQKAWRGSARRVVIFGDDWSDVGQYRMATPPSAFSRDRDPDQGVFWPETLCEQIVCDFIDNFARSIPSNVAIDVIGSMVDSDIFANATSGSRNETLALFDFKAQVEQFIQFESQKRFTSGVLRKSDESTVFTVFFGLWELWEFSVLEKIEAVHAIDRSVDELFHNLNTLADFAGERIQVVLPKLMDVTFLPLFNQPARPNTTFDNLAQDQHQSVYLWTYWNTALSQAAKGWRRGDIYMPDLNSVVLNQVRAKQLYSKQISDASGFGKQAPLFDEVEQPCLSLKADDGDLQAAEEEKCFDPAQHLFWDDIHLSGPANELIGREAARFVIENHTVHVNTREREKEGSNMNQGGQRKAAPGFDLKLPPGY